MQRPLHTNQVFGKTVSGSLLNLTDNSIPEHYAPFNSWDPSVETTHPIIDEEKSFYSNQMTFSNLVDHFKELNEGGYKQLPNVLINNCNTVYSRYL